MTKGEIVRSGDIYCAPGCGRGCTYVEYCHAVASANELAEMLGEGWTTRVWDNLGWHYEVNYKKEGLSVCATRDGKYYASIDHKYHSDNHDDPNNAVSETLVQLSDEIIELTDIYKKITGNRWYREFC